MDLMRIAVVFTDQSEPYLTSTDASTCKITTLSRASIALSRGNGIRDPHRGERVSNKFHHCTDLAQKYGVSQDIEIWFCDVPLARDTASRRATTRLPASPVRRDLSAPQHSVSTRLLYVPSLRTLATRSSRSIDENSK